MKWRKFVSALSEGSVGDGFTRSSIFILVLALGVNGCGRNGSPSDAGEKAQVLATLDGEQITSKDVRERFGNEFEELDLRYRRSRYGLIQMGLDSIIREKLVQEEAARRKKSVNELVAEEAEAPLRPSESEIADWYQRNQRLAGGRPLDQVRSQIAERLYVERTRAAMRKLVERLGKERKIAVLLEPFRLTFNNAGAPASGNSKAPVTLVEFSEFQCPSCADLASTLKRIQQSYGDKVQIIYRQLPQTRIHQFAQKSAEAAYCANDQGKFQQMRDAMFADQAKLAIPELEQKAAAAGLDSGKFNDCLQSARFAKRVQADVDEAMRDDIEGTPAIFVNGAQIRGGAVGFDQISQVIDRELSRQSAK